MTNKARQILIAAREREAHAREQGLSEEAWPTLLEPVLLTRGKTPRKNALKRHAAFEFGQHARDRRHHAA